MNIRTAERSEVKAFQLYDADNAGDCFIVVEHDGELVGFAQYENWSDEAKVFFMESNMRGAGRAMVEWFQANFEIVVAMNVVKEAQPFYAHFGFDDVQKNGWAGQVDMFWYSE